MTFGTVKRRWAICAMTRLVLSPFVAAMNTSARSMPASSSASISRAVPSVNWPPESSHESRWSLSRRSWDSGSSSRTETSWPAASVALATADPTRPAPTMRTNMLFGTLPRAVGRAGAVLCHLAGGRGEDHTARGFGDHVLRDVSHEVLARAAPAAEQRAAAHPRRFLRRHHDRLDAAALGLADDRLARVARAD